MTIEELDRICSLLKGITKDIKWEDHLCFNIGGKIFLITSPDQVPPNASFKVTEEDFSILTEREGIGQARYFAKRQWVAVDNLDRLNPEEWEHYARKSYDLVASGLTKKLQKELGII